MIDATSHYQYWACDGQGRSARGQVAAGDVLEAAAVLENEGLAPLAIWPSNQTLPRARAWPGADVVELVSRLEPVLTAAGDPVPALQAAAGSARSRRVAAAFSLLAGELEAGRSWAEAGWRLAPELPPAVATLLTVGLAGDRWESPLREFLAIERTALVARRRVFSAFSYPFIVLVAFFLCGSVMTTYLVPQVFNAFEETISGDADMLNDSWGWFSPETIRRYRHLAPLVQIMDLVGRNLPGLSVVLAGAACAGALAWRRPAGRARLRRLSWELPVWGRGAQLTAMAGWCRRLGALVEADVPLPRALATVARASQGEVLAAPGFRLAAAVGSGRGLADAMAEEPLFLPTAGPWLAWAESQNALVRTCRVLSSWYTRRAELGLEAVATQLPLAIFLVVGLMAAALLTSVLAPVIRLIGFLS